MTVPSLIPGKMAVFDKTDSLVMMPCAALSLLPSRQSCQTRRSCLNCMLIERMARHSFQQDRATQQDTLSLLQSRLSWSMRRSTLNHVLMESMVKQSYPTRHSQTRSAPATQTRVATSPQSVLGELASSFTRSIMERSLFSSHDHEKSSRWSSGNNHGGQPRVNFITHYHGEPKRELCHHYGDQLIVNSFYKVCQGHGLPTQDHGEPKRQRGEVMKCFPSLGQAWLGVQVLSFPIQLNFYV